MLQEETIPAVYPTIVHTKQEEVYQAPTWQSSSPGPVHYPQLQSFGPVGSASGYMPMPVHQASPASVPPMPHPQQQPQQQPQQPPQRQVCGCFSMSYLPVCQCCWHLFTCPLLCLLRTVDSPRSKCAVNIDNALLSMPHAAYSI